MACFRALSFCHKYWKQLWKESPNSCFSPSIGMQALFSFSYNALNSILFILYEFYYFKFCHKCITIFQHFNFAPFVGWLSDIKFGRYDTIKFGTLIYLFASAFVYIAPFTGNDFDLSRWLFSVAVALVSLVSFSAALLIK